MFGLDFDWVILCLSHIILIQCISLSSSALLVITSHLITPLLYIVGIFSIPEHVIDGKAWNTDVIIVTKNSRSLCPNAKGL